jgi:hypothetical protein
MSAQTEIVKILIDRGNKLSNQPYERIKFTNNEDADNYLNDIENHSHFYVLACSMDRKIPAERAWIIPYKVGQEIGGYSFNKFETVSLESLQEIFISKRLHYFNNIMFKIFYNAIQKIKSKYGGNASNIWKNSPPSATVVKRFLEFNGIGIKIATMAVNALSRNFKVSFADKRYIDISPDVQVKRVFKRLGFIEDENNIDALIYTARELNPDYPGIFDFSVWDLGRDLCRPREPSCNECFLNTLCPKKL